MAQLGFGEILHRWNHAKNQQPDMTLGAFLIKNNPWIFAHHPADSIFREHVWCFRGLFFCKGCIVTLTGVFAGLLLAGTTGWLRISNASVVTFTFVLLLLPTLFTSFFHGLRLWKHASRFLLGVLMGSAAWFLFITDSWFLRVLVVAVYLFVKVPLERKRVCDNQRALQKVGRSCTCLNPRTPVLAGCSCPKK